MLSFIIALLVNSAEAKILLPLIRPGVYQG